MKKALLLSTSIFFTAVSLCQAQDDLLNELSKDGNTGKQAVTTTFKGTKIINAHTTEMLKARNLDFRVGHRFSSVGQGSGGNGHNLYGLDNSMDIRIAFEMGITDKFTLGLSRNKFMETYEGLLKYRFMEQSVDGKRPMSIVFFANTAVTGTKGGETSKYLDKFTNRMSYSFQAIFARKFSEYFSFELLPTLVHRNYVNSPYDKNDLYALGAGGRLKLTSRSAIVGDYFFVFGNNKRVAPGMANPYYNPLSLGWEIETGGHVFTLMFTNSAGIIENSFIPYTTDSWAKGGFKFCFNISRVFKI